MIEFSMAAKQRPEIFPSRVCGRVPSSPESDFEILPHARPDFLPLSFFSRFKFPENLPDAPKRFAEGCSSEKKAGISKECRPLEFRSEVRG